MKKYDNISLKDQLSTQQKGKNYSTNPNAKYSRAAKDLKDLGVTRDKEHGQPFTSGRKFLKVYNRKLVQPDYGRRAKDQRFVSAQKPLAAEQSHLDQDLDQHAHNISILQKDHQQATKYKEKTQSLHYQSINLQSSTHKLPMIFNPRGANAAAHGHQPNQRLGYQHHSLANNLYLGSSAADFGDIDSHQNKKSLKEIIGGGGQVMA